MTLATTAPATDLVTQLAGDGGSSVSMMIGIGIVKDSEAVFFEYVGEKEHKALMLPQTGKPLTRIADVQLTGISVAEDIGEFKASKLNLYFTTEGGVTVLMTSGLTTLWSQCVLTGLMGLFDSQMLQERLCLDTWKGKNGMRPCFAAIRVRGQKISDQSMFDQLKESRAAKDGNKVKAIMRDAVNILAAAIGYEEAEVAIVEENETEGDF